MSSVTTLFALWIVSMLLVFIGYIRYNYVSVLDVFVISGWFFTFYRPIFMCECSVNKDLYLWDADLYEFGTVYGAFSLILFQIGYTFFPKSVVDRVKRYNKLSTDKAKLTYLLRKNRLALIGILGLLYVSFGNSLFYGFNEVDSAMSLSVPGLEYGFRLVGVAISILIPIALIYFYRFGFNFIAFTALLLAIAAGIIFGKRGMLVSPFLIGVSACTFFSDKKLMTSKSLARSLVTMLAIIGLGFYMIFGKVLKDLPEIDVREVNISCLILEVGMQEFDLLWPATIKVRESFSNLTDLPVALASGLYYGHAERMQLKVGSYHSITDKTMLLYNYDAYVFQKFGISPNTYQFYYSYFGFLSLLVVLVLGSLLRKVEMSIFRSIANFNFYRTILLYFSLNLLLSPFDITLKYYLLDFFILFLFSIRLIPISYNKK